MSYFGRGNFQHLGTYNSFGTNSLNTIHPPLPNGTPSMAIQVVPVYGMPGYEALTHDNQMNGSGYFSIGAAYPSYPSSCDRFVQRPCAGFI